MSSRLCVKARTDRRIIPSEELVCFSSDLTINSTSVLMNNIFKNLMHPNYINEQKYKYMDFILSLTPATELSFVPE